MYRLALIGCGDRAAQILPKRLEQYPDLKLTAVVDTDIDGAKHWIKERYPVEPGEVKFFADTDAWLSSAGDKCDAVMIATRCSTHAELACRVAPLGVPVFLEKPVAISHEQLATLHRAYEGREQSVVVSFPLRLTGIFETVLDIVRSGRLGTVNQIQAINNVPYGGVYYSTPYRDWDITGGLWLQKATHDFDYITLLAGGRPEKVAATQTQRIYGGEMPHDLWCSKCDIAADCAESPGDGGVRPSGKDHPCMFSREIKNQDAGSAMIQFDNRINTTYSQNFVSRRTGTRGAIVTGYKGTVRFDWYGETATLTEHHTSRTDQIEVKATGGHGGGDSRLYDNFVRIIRGEEASQADLTAGIRSVAMCLAARESAETGAFQPVRMPGE